ncbi:TrmH family RNA methyltransferase [Gordonibacter massiliensis (ex Traore et al. 2017)]|uniref:RNA methyltransferase n=1 Tax=Gordonibacter massiliensis (ex Traore et al. 2017) TaxID=1841863 RepID=A0A842J7L1_9ACTN|nr:RNA methyltransferase [Gordonibacter massiliensis (ex Traore et al. 2017)]MBC2887783.1 RNA methyltransferase [Gordonibacter massiliensis (ex Traore et al. 2017)]
MIVRVDTLDDPRLDAYARLTDVQLRSRLEPEKGLFIAESGNVIERALEAGMQPLSLLMEEKWLDALRPLIERAAAANPDAPVFVAPRAELAKLTGFELTRGALAAFRRPALPSVADVVRDARRIAVLENVTNHTNVGAIFRSAAALGMDAVLVTPSCYDPLYRRAVRVSMGTVFQIPWTRIGEDGECTDPRKATSGAWAAAGIPLLRELGFATAAFALSDDSVSLDDPRLAAEERLALVFGTEGDGLSPVTISGCDYTVRIPMQHGVDSLNVAAASAVAFWALRR